MNSRSAVVSQHIAQSAAGVESELTQQEIPTPALVLDLDLFQANVARMAEIMAARGKVLRPHAKAHKCPEIAKRQIAAGAIGVCVATVTEAEAMAAAGIRNLLLTSPLADPAKIARMAALAANDPGMLAVVDHPSQAAQYSQAAGAQDLTMGVLIDLDLGDHRTGVAPGSSAIQLARTVASQPHLRLAGVQAYSVRGSHVQGHQERIEFSRAAWAPAIQTFRELQRHGLPVTILTGGSTGTHHIDCELPEVTEIQAGSYVFMDMDYARIGGIHFAHALTVLATVVSANRPDRVTVDAGFKAFSTDRGYPPQAVGIEGVEYAWAGDEFGAVHLNSPSRPIRLGDRLRFLPPHCDPTVNLYNRIYACRGERVEAVWPVMK